MSQSVPMLSGERVVLRPLTKNHALPLFPIFSDPQTMRFMPTPPHQTVAVTSDYLQNELSHKDGRFWAIYIKEEDEPIGIVNYLGGVPIPGMGYIINRAYWGQGLAAEACQLALSYGFDTLHLDRVELWIDERNVQSQRVAQKLGFSLRGQIAQKYPHRQNHHRMYTYGLWRERFYDKTWTEQAPRLFQVQPVLMVRDVATAVAFYTEKLEFTIDFLYGEPTQHAGVSHKAWTGQGVTLQLTTLPQEQAFSTSSYLYIFTDSRLDELYEKYQQAGVAIKTQPQSYPWGMREFSITDVDGHRLVFATQT